MTTETSMITATRALTVVGEAIEAVQRGSAQVSSRKGTLTFRFGTSDIRDFTDGARGVSCARVYEDPASREECGHRHRDAATAMRCARSMASGEWSQSRGKSWVEIVVKGDADDA